MVTKTKKPVFNMSAAIREELKANPKVKFADALANIQKRNPKQEINKNSFSAGFYSARKGKKTRKVSIATPILDLKVLNAAVIFLKEVGPEMAEKAIKTVQSMQLK